MTTSIRSTADLRLKNELMEPLNSPFQFALLYHSFANGESTDRTSVSHFDLLLESPCRSHLLTWELADNIFDESLPATFSALQLADHRLIYLNYQGAVSGNRGTVQQVLCGELQWQEISEQRVTAKLPQRQQQITLEHQFNRNWLGRLEDISES